MASAPGFVGEGDIERVLDESGVAAVLRSGLDPLDVEGKRVLVIIPDGTRNAPVPMIYRLLYELIGPRVTALDYLIALGTHPPMSEDAISSLIGMTAAQRAEETPKSQVFNHQWHLDEALMNIGTIDEAEMAVITDGLVTRKTSVRINRMISDYDHIIIVGPVFPHEAAGFSGGAKYLFPGIAGPDIIDSIHWMGALATSSVAMGVKDTAVRRMIHRAAEFVAAGRPLTLIALTMQATSLHGVYVGDHRAAWEAAADLSAELNIAYTGRSFASVLSMAPLMYGDMWTAAKATYKTEPIVEDGGEVIVYAPHVTDISVVHGDLIREAGYHVRDYFVKQWDRFSHLPLVILAHSTHVKGLGEFTNGVEEPRINVTLATGISEAECRFVNLGYRDPAEIDPEDWSGGEQAGRLLVEDAGELLYRVTRS